MPPVDLLDPGPDGDYPHVRDEDGYLDPARMPVGTRWQLAADGTRHLIDPEPTVRDRDGQLVPISAVVPLRPRPAR